VRNAAGARAEQRRAAADADRARLAQEPGVLLLDEPTAFLDLKHALEIDVILRRLNAERGLTVVTVSHDLNLAARQARRLVLLQHGRIVADGPPADVLTPAGCVRSTRPMRR